MPFDIGEHRAIDEIDARDITILAADLDIGLSAFDRAVNKIIDTIESPSIESLSQPAEKMIDRILDNSKDRLNVLKQYLGAL